MKVKKKHKHLENEEESNSDVAHSCGDADGGMDPVDKPPDDLGFVLVLDLLRRYLWMLSTMNRDQLRELIDQGIL